MSSSVSINKKALVIGGGIAGLAACVALRKKDKHVEILLVEPKSYFQVPWATYRAVLDPKMREASIFDLQTWCAKYDIAHLATTVTSLTETTATLGNGQVIDDFAVAAVCVGAVCKWPSLGRCPAIAPTLPPLNNKSKTKKAPPAPKGNVLTKQERMQELEDDAERLLNAGSVMVVGGGMIGVETAGDLAYFAAKHEKALEVTLVHSGGSLIPEFPDRASKMVLQKLTKLGVQVILNEKVMPKSKEEDSTSPITTFHLHNSNQEISVDQVIWTTGIAAQNHAFLDSKYLTKKGGWIQVNETFQLTRCENGKLFAFGDCCNLLPNAGIQVLGAMTVFGHNLKVALDASEVAIGSKDAMKEIAHDVRSNKKRKQKMKKALEQAEVYIVTIGKKDGVALTPFGATGIGLPMLKNKTQFLMKPKTSLGLS